MNPTKKDYTRFEKKLTNILNSSGSAKEWSDLLSLIQEILSLLNKNQNLEFAKLSNRYLLSKRLAQCLNPECPSGVHDVVLEIYNVILHNIISKNEAKLMDNLGLYACGLFPFFTNATLANKTKYLNIIVKNNLLCIDINELILCLPGLLASIIPGLDDNNDKMTALIYETLDAIKLRIKEHTFFGVYWTLILRNKHIRASGMKYLIEKTNKYQDYLNMKLKKSDIIYNYYPNINTVVVNALCGVIEENDIPTVRMGMDFIITRFPLSKENDLINDNAKINLIISALKLLVRNEYSTTRRLNNWLLGINNAMDEVDYESEDMHYKIGLLTIAIKSIFKYDKNKTLKQEELVNYLKVIEQLLAQQVEFIDYILPKVSYDILRCVVNFWKTELNSSENAYKNIVINKIRAFFIKDAVFNEFLWISISDNLNKLNKESDNSINYINLNLNLISGNNNNTIKEPLSNSSSNLLNTSFSSSSSEDKNSNINTNINTSSNINNNNKNSDTVIISNKKNSNKSILALIDEIFLPLKFCLLFIDINDDETRIKYFIPIITHLLNIMKKLKFNNIEGIKKMRQILLITLIFLKNLQDNNDMVEKKDEKNNSSSNNSLKNDRSNFNNKIFFKEMTSEDGNLTRFIIKNESSLNIILNKISKEVASNFISSILSYQEFYISILEKYLKIDKKTEITKTEMTTFRQCTELMIRLEEYAQHKEVPSWVIYLEKIIYNQRGNLKLSLEAANYILDLNLSSLNENHIYKIIRDHFQKDEIDSSVIDKNYLNILVKKTGVQKNCFELLIAKLYLIIKEQSCQKTIIDLLIKIATLDQVKFTNILSNTFNLDNFNQGGVGVGESLAENIKLFSDFWKLKNEFYSDIIFFSNGECIFKMIDFLEDKNPLLRHLAKSWLNQNNKHFDKIIDPLLSVLLQDYSNFVKIDNKIIFEKEYESGRIIDAFSKLKNIILNSGLMDYIKTNIVGANLLIKDRIKNIKTKNSTYLSLLISITLSYIRCKSSKKINPKFEIENYSVNAASCEFFEFLLSRVNNNDLLISYLKEINLPILFTLDEAIEHNDEVMQVQLLSVLKVLYFNPNIINKNEILNLFHNEILKKVLIKGMTRDYFFVREHFINFTKDCLYLLKNKMKDIDGIKNLFNVGQSFIGALIYYLCGRVTVEKNGRKEIDKFSHFDVGNNKIIFKNYLEEYKEYKRYDENDVLMILKGIKDILFYFLNINNDDNGKNKDISYKEYNSLNDIEYNQNISANNNAKIDEIESQNQSIPSINKKIFNGNWFEYKQNLITRDKTSSSFIEFISNFFDSNDFDKIEQDEELSLMPKNLYSSQIFNLLNGLILTWINQSEKYEVYDYCLNSNGILPLKEMSSWNKISEEEISKAQQEINKQPIKLVVREIAFNLFITNPTEFIENIIKLWCCKNDPNNEGNIINACIDKQYKLSIIEFLISLEIPLNIILYCIGKIIQKNIKNRNNIYKKHSVYKIISTPYDLSIYESKIFHFLYSYILLNPSNSSNDKFHELTEVWREMINILNTVMYDTKIIYTQCWLYEIMELTSEKYKLSDMAENSEIQKKISNIFYYITNKLIESSINNKLDSKYTRDDKIVMPYLPHIYSNVIEQLYNENLFKKETSDTNKKDNEQEEELINNNENDNINEFIILNNDNNSNKNIYNQNELKGNVNHFYFNYCFDSKLCSEYSNIDPKNLVPVNLHKLNDYHRKISFIILKENFWKLLSKIFYSNSTIQRKYLFDIIKYLISLIKQNSTNFFGEFSTDFLVSLMQSCPKDATLCGKSMFMDYFNDPDFFVTKPKMIKNWRKIISSSVKYYPEILKDLINNIDSGFLFLKGSDEEKMKTLRRISFVIYSCEKDTFHNQFDLIRSKAKDFLSGYSSNVLLESEIFLMMRILFLRFSHLGVMKMIKDLWPIIFMELIMNIENEERNNKVKLVLESLKFIELLSLANIEEFILYQWIFIIDTFDMQNLNYNNKNSLLFNLMQKDNKIFHPFAFSLLNLDDLKNVDDKLLEGKHKSKNELYIRIKKENIDELQTAVKKYFFAIGDMNSYQVSEDYNQVEDIIEKDFIAEKQMNIKR